jgi:glycogen operon protein
MSTAISFKAIDNASYYRLDPNDKSKYIDNTGCGNSLDLNKPMAKKMTVDSLRYWVEEMGVDGFRFDLASTNARDENNNFSIKSGFLDAINNDPVLKKVKLISEPWDCAAGGYQVGKFPKPWRDWNDKFRDTTRRFWCGQFGLSASMAQRISGSDDISKGGEKSPSINFITAHDGFTLHDLVSYNHKHNDANGEQGRDGANENHSWNTGVEGKTNDPVIKSVRAQRERNMLATLLLARGVPMLTAGDEFSRTQGGNNNPYNQDNDISHIDWDNISEHGKENQAFVKKLLKLRKKHPIIGSDKYLTGQKMGEMKEPDVKWLRPDGQELDVNDWQNHGARAFSYVLNGEAAEYAPHKKTNDTDGTKKSNGSKGADDDFLVIVNAHEGNIAWKLPPAPAGGKWEMAISTAKPNIEKDKKYEAGESFNVHANSVTVFTCKRKNKQKQLEKVVLNSSFYKKLNQR